MYYLCLSCGEVFNSKYFSPQSPNDFYRCPKASCFGRIVQIDELMLPIIKKLIDLGYQTNYCCSGHSYENFIGSYISFTNDNNIENLLTNFPLTWKIEPFNGGFAIYPKNQSYQNEQDMISKQKQIFSLLSELMDWVEKLPKS